MTVFAALLGLDQPSPRGAVILSNVGQFVAPLLASLACWAASRRAPDGRLRAGWRLLAASALSWSLGQMIWTFYEVSAMAAPFPSFADVGYLLAMPLALVAVGTL
ncbi:MAG: putative diguanylate cyclase, partial [Acidimicrobiales bacterium]|nr:putative diguanylate cyclase [Acidimicrobiales bacterium]